MNPQFCLSYYNIIESYDNVLILMFSRENKYKAKLEDDFNFEWH